jgi:hypothetical protein
MSKFSKEQRRETNPTPSQQALRTVITRLGALPPEQQDRVIEAAGAGDERDGLTAEQWHQVRDETA